MIKVMIVDDEILVRNKLKKLIDWERHGFTICKECTNGLEAISCMDEVMPDIVIFDVSMPKMDGVELSKHISKHYQFIKMLAISSYDDYDYVREIMKNGAKDYVLKHKLNSSELLYFLLNAAVSIYKNDETRVDNIIQIVSYEEILYDAIIKNNINTQELFTKLRIGDKEASTVMAVITMTNSMKIIANLGQLNKTEFSEGILSLVKSRLDDYYHGVVSKLSDNTIVMIFDIKSVIGDRELNAKVDKLLSNVKLFLNKCYNIQSNYSWKRINKEMNLIEEYEELLCLGNYKYEYGKQSVFLPIYQEERLLNAVNIKDVDLINNCIDNIVAEFKASDANFESYQILIDEIKGIIKKISRQYDIKSNELNMLLQNTNEPRDMNQNFQLLKDIFKVYVNQVESEANSQINDYIKEARDYIRSSYHDSNLSLTVVADKVGISAQYLSKIFSQTELSYVDFVNSVRIDASKRMLSENKYNAKDISYRCGFNSYNHFYKVFKSLTGMSPGEYMKTKK